MNFKYIYIYIYIYFVELDNINILFCCVLMRVVYDISHLVYVVLDLDPRELRGFLFSFIFI